MSRITYDLDVHEGGPAPGDLLYSNRSVWRIRDSRPVDSRVHPNRWALQCDRIGLVDQMNVTVHPEPGGRCWPIEWYGRNRGPTLLDPVEEPCPSI